MKMAKTIGEIEVLHERRLVELSDGSLGYFHCWEHFSWPGVKSVCFALIEKEDGFVSRFELCDFRFVDAEHEMLKELSKDHKEHNKCQT